MILTERWRKLIGWGVITGIVGGIGLDAWITSGHEPVIYEAEAHEIEVLPKEVLIEVKIDWTPERVKEEIREVFGESADTMIEVAKCESGLIPHAEGPTNDGGIFQIHRPSHKHRIYGMDLYDPAQNIRFAKVLYDESGLQPWKASKFCWSK